MSHSRIETRELRIIAESLPEGELKRWCERLGRRGDYAVVAEGKLQSCRDEMASDEKPKSKPKSKRKTVDRDENVQGQSIDHLDFGSDVGEGPETSGEPGVGPA